MEILRKAMKDTIKDKYAQGNMVTHFDKHVANMAEYMLNPMLIGVACSVVYGLLQSYAVLLPPLHGTSSQREAPRGRLLPRLHWTRSWH